MKKLLHSLFILFILFSFSIFFWWKINSSPINNSDRSQKIFVVSQGKSIRAIGNDLEKAGLIKNALAFFLWVKWQKLENKIQSGDFRLSPSQSLATITQNLTHGSLDYWLTIVPGKRATEVAEILKEKAPNYTDSWRQKLVTNEGYLFPDSYLIPTSDTIEHIIVLIRKNFDAKVATIGELPANISQNKLVIIASVIEKEAQFLQDQAMVASVIYNRLEQNMPLQMDPTVQYAIGYNQREHAWWTKGLTVDDLKIDSPYNTYLHTGLPPTAICNPGISALKATIQPAKTDYLYYVSDKTGHLHFAKTLEQHNANIQKYQVQ